MKAKNIILPIFMMITVVIYSCNDKESPAPVQVAGLNYQYAPSNIGHEVVYDISLITKDEFSGEEDTANYQLKEVIASTFTDIAGRPTQRIERFTRADTASPWIIADVWTANLLTDRYEKNEENTPYVKIKFPITNGAEWNGNLYNSFPAQPYTYTSIDDPSVVNGINFDSTLTVLQSDYEDLLEKSFSAEQYATGVGLIFKESIFIKKDFNNPGTIKAQTKYRQTIVSYSN